MTPSTDIKSLSYEELKNYISRIGQPSYRADQIMSALVKGPSSLDEIKAIPGALRQQLAGDFSLYAPSLVRTLQSQVDGTIKYLWRLRDGNCVETVVMQYEHGNSICISSQVGCRMGCAFCASTIGGLVRSLDSSEMLDEVVYSQKESGRKISNIVIMGIGEPLDNYDNVIHFLHLANEEKGLNIGMRHITLSTCGLLDKVRKLAEEDLQITLAVSLHSCKDEVRSEIVPVNRACSVAQVCQTSLDYFKKTGRRITFEYALIKGVNDSSEDAAMLAKIALKAKAHINLIRLNRVPESALLPCSESKMKEFCSILDRHGANYTVRRRLGSDVNAACGQLRRSNSLQLSQEKGDAS